MTHTQLPWKSSWREDDKHGSIYSMPREGHAYAVAVKPRYVEREQWEADAHLIVRAVNSHDALVKALEFYANPEVYRPHPHGPAFDRRDLSNVAVKALATVQRDGKAAT